MNTEQLLAFTQLQNSKKYLDSQNTHVQKNVITSSAGQRDPNTGKINIALPSGGMSQAVVNTNTSAIPYGSSLPSTIISNDGVVRVNAKPA